MAIYSADDGKHTARFSSRVCISSLVSMDDRPKSRGKGRTKLKGEQARPTTRAKLKFRVASMDSVAPRNSREKDCNILTC